MRSAFHPVRGAAVALCLVGSPVVAQWDCTLNKDHCVTSCETLAVTFDVDRSLFVAPQNPNDPPRRTPTSVQMGDARFVAEAILMDGGIEGFYEDAGALGNRLMIVQADGSARLSMRPANEIWTGVCEKR